jgi:Condensation domain/AMP-binding enzyme/AMP-binding enzyme C-terminal domain/Phosphopantetheine attachment site
VLLEPESFAEVLARQGVTILHLTTGLFNQYADALRDVFSKVKVLLFGGEAADLNVTRKVLRQSSPRCLIHLYGPTETTAFASSYRVESIAEAAKSIPIGRPISNTQIYILDRELQPVPIGVVGELYIGGAGVARGYLNRAELTAQRFVADRFSADPRARLYRTGDLGRWRADGNIEYLGRNDHQVKLRGFRIELGEIEAQLSRRTDIREAVVIARDEGTGEKRLVAYVVSATAEGVSVEQLRADLKERLPEYMVPSAFVLLESLPLTPNGKLDRNALPAPDGEAYARREYEAPQGEIEQCLAQLWQELLGVPRVGRHDNFFELGGHSLLAVQLVTRIRVVLDREVGLREVFEYPSILEMARQLSGAAAASVQPIDLADRAGTIALSLSQQRLWFLDQLEGAGSAYHIAGAVGLIGTLDAGALRAALDTIIERHEVLRTVFAQAQGEVLQVIAEQARFSLREIDASGEPLERREGYVRACAVEEAQQRFELSQGPLIRGCLIKLGEQEHVLMMTMHHIVSDGWSLGILIREVATLYTAYREGRSNPLPALPIQYADYAVWQRQWLQGEVLARQLGY